MKYKSETFDMNIYDEGFHDNLEREHDMTLDRIAEVDEPATSRLKNIPRHKMGLDKMVTGKWGSEDIVRPMTIAEKMERDIHDEKVKKTMTAMVSVFDHVTRPVSSREVFLDKQIEEAERINNAPCTCSFDDVKEGTRCEACVERANLHD